MVRTGWSGTWQRECVIFIRRVGLEDLREVVGAIDRSEHVDGEYAVVGVASWSGRSR